MFPSCKFSIVFVASSIETRQLQLISEKRNFKLYTWFCAAQKPEVLLKYTSSFIAKGFTHLLSF